MTQKDSTEVETRGGHTLSQPKRITIELGLPSTELSLIPSPVLYVVWQCYTCSHYGVIQLQVTARYSKGPKMGVPQGSILSVTLFGLKINSISKSIAPGVECSLYVDDFLICYRSKYDTTILMRAQKQTSSQLSLPHGTVN